MSGFPRDPIGGKNSSTPIVIAIRPTGPNDVAPAFQRERARTGPLFTGPTVGSWASRGVS
jgi:hypothetical protein